MCSWNSARDSRFVGAPHMKPQTHLRHSLGRWRLLVHWRTTRCLANTLTVLSTHSDGMTLIAVLSPEPPHLPRACTLSICGARFAGRALTHDDSFAPTDAN